MQCARLFMMVILVLIIGSGCDGGHSKPGRVTVDSSLAPAEAQDSSKLVYADCYEHFFSDLPRLKDSVSAFLILQNGRRITLTQFFRDEFMSQVSEYGLKDLDRDGVEELIVFNNTGGAHCCDEYFIFASEKANDYHFKAHMLGGKTCINAASNVFTYSFSETFGYFFTCYACEFSDSIGNMPIIREVQLKYVAGKMEVQPYSPSREQENLANLALLQKHGFEAVEGLMDSGWRKEFALNIAVWHFNHQKNWKLTKELFDKYYTFPDAEKVWNEFFHILQDFSKENTF